MVSNSLASSASDTYSEKYSSFHDGVIYSHSLLETAFSGIDLAKVDLSKLRKGQIGKIRYSIAASTIFPRLCHILGRGITREEMSLIIGIDQSELGRIIRDPTMRKSFHPTESKVSGVRYGRLLVQTVTEPEHIPKNNPKKPKTFSLIVPRKEISRNKIGLKMTMARGPLPSIYFYESNKECIEEYLRRTPEEIAEFDERIGRDGLACELILENQLIFINNVKKFVNSLASIDYLVGLSDIFISLGANLKNFSQAYDEIQCNETRDLINNLAVLYEYVAQELLCFRDIIISPNEKRLLLEALSEQAQELEKIRSLNP